MINFSEKQAKAITVLRAIDEYGTKVGTTTSARSALDAALYAARDEIEKELALEIARSLVTKYKLFKGNE